MPLPANTSPEQPLRRRKNHLASNPHKPHINPMQTYYQQIQVARRIARAKLIAKCPQMARFAPRP